MANPHNIHARVKSRDVHERQRPAGGSNMANPHNISAGNMLHTRIEPAMLEDFFPSHLRKNDNEKIILVCASDNCSWRIYASRHKSDNLFGIRKCNLIHSCGDDNLRTRGHPKADSSWVANVVMERLREEPSYRPCMMLKDIQRDFGVELSYHKVWKGKELAMHDIHGADDEPLVFLDGTHIKNKYKGNILVVVVKDANDDLFTLAYAVVDAKNDDNWRWFCFHLRGALCSHNCMGFDEFTFFSDRHPGIINGVELIFPSSHHAYCQRHLVDNFVKQVMRIYPLHNKKHWSSVFKKAAYAPSRSEFEHHINSIITSMPLAKDFIVNSCPERWANALFRGNRWGVINNNMAECWNSWVKSARFLPIVRMVDHIRIQIMDMMHRRRETTMKMKKRLSPSKENILARTYAETRNLQVRKASGWSFEVVDGDKSFAVDLSSTRILNPIPTFEMHESSVNCTFVINPPDVQSQPGRRRTKRIPSQVELREKEDGRSKTLQNHVYKKVYSIRQKY
ncbi:uncharacterized protein [Henckelia pumila]|uniref:uncharacterized protein n=1 Tax=Henckelia pumila TaxID=405737 RepID=UPI003C6DE6A1